jgi:hypothetical protein
MPEIDRIVPVNAMQVYDVPEVPTHEDVGATHSRDSDVLRVHAL